MYIALQKSLRIKKHVVVCTFMQTLHAVTSNFIEVSETKYQVLAKD